MKKSIEQLVREEIAIVPHRPEWEDFFEKEKAFLRAHLPGNLIGRIEHFGSTAVPGLAAKPVVDVLAETVSSEVSKEIIAPLLESLGYEYYWRTDTEPAYAWFIKRNEAGERICHLHLAEPDSALWDGLYFRDYLRQFPAEARRYEALKRELAARFPHDRVAYTEGKTAYIVPLTQLAKSSFSKDKDRRPG